MTVYNGKSDRKVHCFFFLNLEFIVGVGSVRDRVRFFSCQFSGRTQQQKHKKAVWFSRANLTIEACEVH